MSDKRVLLQIVNYLTSEHPPQPRYILLEARYQHSQQLSLLMDLLSLIYNGKIFQTRQTPLYKRLFPFLKSMLSSADLLTNLLLNSKLFPALSKTQANLKVPKVFQEILKEGNSSSKYNINENKSLTQARKNSEELIQWCQKNSYFQFYFHLLNNGHKNPQEDIDSFMLQVSIEEESFWSEEEMKDFRVELLTECQKMAKSNYREEALKGIYPWIKQQVLEAFIQNKDKNDCLTSKEVLSRIILTRHDLTCVALVHSLKWILTEITSHSFKSFLSVIDQLIISGNSLTALHTVLLLTPLIFTQILKKNITVPFETISSHYQLWSQAMQKRQIQSKLLLCQKMWLPIIFMREPLDDKYFDESFQLYRRQMAKLYKESRVSQLKNLIEDLEMKAIELIYQEMEPFHSQIEALQESKSTLKQKQQVSIKATSKVQFSFKVSQASQKEEIRSLIQSLRSSKGVQKTISKPNNQEQLKIYSKRHSIINSHLQSENSVTEDVHQILHFFEMFQEPSVVSSYLSKEGSQSIDDILKIPFLPILSKNSEIEESKMQELIISEEDPYGIKKRCKVTTKILEVKVIPLRHELRRKVLKNRGLITKNSWMEIGYLMDSHYKRRRLTLYITFFRRVETMSVVVIEKSVKFWKKGKLLFSQPKIKEQYKSILEIEKIKLYQIEGIQQSHRFIRPKVQLQGKDIKGQILTEIHEVPIYLYNMLQWLEIANNQTYIPDLEPQSSSEWLPLCSKVLKNKEQELGLYFPLVKCDRKGNLCLKFTFLHEVIFAKVYLVLEKVKVVLINSDWDLALMALLEMLVEM